MASDRSRTEKRLRGKQDDSEYRGTVPLRSAKQILLFEDDHRVDESKVSKVDGSRCSRVTKHQLFDVFKRDSPVPPNAPVKPKRQVFSKVGLKPKRLDFIDKERNGEIVGSSSSSSSSSSGGGVGGGGVGGRGEDCEFANSIRKSREQLNRKNVDAMLQTLQLDATSNDKENRRYEYDANRFVGRIKDARTERTSKRSAKLSAKGYNGGRRVAPDRSRISQGLQNWPSVLSQCDDNLSKEEKLLWLQPRRDVGIFIECCRKTCKKWRYTDDYHDPVNVPQIWYCEMNSDKSVASCAVPQVPLSEECEYDLIENKYNAGSIVWARVNGYPWWPAMVDDCPEALRYYELREPSIIPVKYHVTFFDEHRLRHAWLNCDRIKPFVKHDKKNLVRKTVFYGVDRKVQVEKACALAQRAISWTILRRLQTFSCASLRTRMQGFRGNRINGRDKKMTKQTERQSDDETIPVTPPSHWTITTTKQFYDRIKNNTDSSSNTC